MPFKDFFNSPKRLVPVNKSRRINTFQRFEISPSVVSTGQMGSSFPAMFPSTVSFGKQAS